MDKAHKWETLMWGGLDYCFVLGLILMRMPMNFQKCRESEQIKIWNFDLGLGQTLKDSMYWDFKAWNLDLGLKANTTNFFFI
jgi:hypothetical protein